MVCGQARRQSSYSLEGGLATTQAIKDIAPPSLSVALSHLTTSCPATYDVSPLNLTTPFDSRITNMTEHSNHTYSSRIAERPSLRIVEQRSMIRVMIMVQDSETLGEGV